MTPLRTEIEKSEIFSLLNTMNEVLRSYSPNYLLYSFVQLDKLLYLQYKFWAQRGHTHFKGSKRAQK